MLSNLTKLAERFEEELESVNGPGSAPPISAPPVSKAPISIDRNMDLNGSITADFHKSSILMASTMLENMQKNLAHFLAGSLERHGMSISSHAIHKELRQFGEYSKAEEDFVTALSKLLVNYSDKATHYIINNLSR